MLAESSIGIFRSQLLDFNKVITVSSKLTISKIGLLQASFSLVLNSK